MSTSTSLSRTSTTVPRTTSPSSMSPTPRLNQSSMLSSGASATSFWAPARIFAFRLSVSIMRCFLLDRSRRGVGCESPLAVLPVLLVLLVLQLLQLRDGAHHFIRGLPVAILAPLASLGLDVYRGSDSYAH